MLNTGWKTVVDYLIQRKSLNNIKIEVSVLVMS